MDQHFWDTRYQGDGYFYGMEANTFLAKQVARLQGPVLSLCEGEGRNGVFMAEQGLNVTGVDISPVALAKAQKLAALRGVNIETIVADLAEFVPPENHYGAVVSIFAHLPGAVRAALYPRLESALKPGGLLLMEAYSENQLARDTGGPKNVDMLMAIEKIRQELPNLEMVLLCETEREIYEGEGHTGLASVVQCIARKS